MSRNLQPRTSLAAADCSVPLRAAVYLRVSTGRQAEGEVSIPSQRDLTTRHCLSNGWSLVDEYVEPGASATDDRRPVFQAMLERACDADHPYDVIVVHSFSRFFRDGATMELTIRKLRRHGVEVVSMTQPTGTDPSQEMMRQIIGIFDEYTSKENGKNVTRAMKENAKQGFWNGASPPLGYNLVEAERRGQKIKKHLAINPVEAETVRLIFRLYAEGEISSGTPPLGIKRLVKWLNSHGYRTKAGGTFGVGPTHHILTNTVYVGRWRYNVRSARTGERKPASEIVEIATPAIVDQDLFDRVGERRQGRLHADRSLFRINPGREIVERDLDDVAAHLFGVVRVVGERLRIGQKQELAMRILHGDTVFQ